MTAARRPIDIAHDQAMADLKNWPAEARANRETDEALRIAADRARNTAKNNGFLQAEADRRALQDQISEGRA